jgi:hypothetical protein
VTNVIVLGMNKTGTTIVASVVQRSIPGALLQMEPDAVAFFEQRPRAQASQVVKVIYQHWARRPTLLSGIVRGETRFRPDRRIAIVRDPRDGVISGLMYSAYGYVLEGATRKQVAEWLELVRDKEANPEKYSVIGLFQAVARIFGKDYAIDAFFDHFLGYAAWLAENRDALHVVRYEDFVAGDTAGLSAYLGFPLSEAREVDPRLERVGRTKGSGDWRRWMLAEDAAYLEKRYGGALEALGYGDWRVRAGKPDPAAGSAYVARIAEEAFRTLPPQEAQPPGLSWGAATLGVAPGAAIARAAEAPRPGSPVSALVVGSRHAGAALVASVIRRSIPGAHLLADPRKVVLLERLARLAVPSVVKMLYEDWQERPLLLEGIVRGESGFRPARTVAVVRDPRDTLVSALLCRAYACVLEGAGERQVEEWLAIVRRKEAEPERYSVIALMGELRRIFAVGDTVDASLETFVRYCRWLSAHAEHWHVLRYEDFVAGSTAALAGYLGLELSADREVDSAVRRPRRTAAPGGWRAVLLPEDVAYLRERYGAALERHGYRDWELLPGRLDPAEGSRYVRTVADEAFQRLRQRLAAQARR